MHFKLLTKMNKLFLYKIAYQFYSFLASITKNNKYLKQKLLFGGLIIAIVAISSCKAKHPPHKCYAPVMKDIDQVYLDSESSSDIIESELQSNIEINI